MGAGGRAGEVRGGLTLKRQLSRGAEASGVVGEEGGKPWASPKPLAGIPGSVVYRFPVFFG